jgi:adenine-specific DNA methylase
VNQPFKKQVEAKPHSPIYTMHKYFARRPHNVFAELIKHYTNPNDIILDPFCGGGVTVVEAIAAGRKAIGVDVNPLATYVTRMEITPLERSSLLETFDKLWLRLEPTMKNLFRTTCPVCQEQAEIQWTEWKDTKQFRIQYVCPKGHKGKKKPTAHDVERHETIKKIFVREVKKQKLWYPKNKIPEGDKTNSIIKKGYEYFWQLFTQRNLLALSLLYKEISRVQHKNARDFLFFAFSASLKWASKQCHLRGDVVDGWAMHAYWIYPKQLEINVWHTFSKRVQAVLRGKEYLEERGFTCKPVQTFRQLRNGGNALLFNRSADKLPLPDNFIDCIITDPPYGGNVNYGELSDFWTIWNPELGTIIDKQKEAVINKTQSKDVRRYEEILWSVFRECSRVLKPDGVMVATFNSKDLEIVCTFLRAAARGGFELMKHGLQYQEPIKAYTTTVHAKEVGAFTGDFIFTFRKSKRNVQEKTLKGNFWKQAIDTTVDRHARHSRTEIEFRRGVYEHIIPLLAGWVYVANGQSTDIARYAEKRIRQQSFIPLSFTVIRSMAR